MYARSDFAPPRFSFPDLFHEVGIGPVAGLYKIQVCKWRDGDWGLQTIYVGQASDLRERLNLNSHPATPDWFACPGAQYGLYLSIAEMPGSSAAYRSRWEEHFRSLLEPVGEVRQSQERNSVTRARDGSGDNAARRDGV